MPKPDKYTIRKGNHRPIFMMSIGMKNPHKVVANHLQSIVHHDQVGIHPQETRMALFLLFNKCDTTN
jgi:hypothetical protein